MVGCSKNFGHLAFNLPLVASIGFLFPEGFSTSLPRRAQPLLLLFKSPPGGGGGRKEGKGKEPRGRGKRHGAGGKVGRMMVLCLRRYFTGARVFADCAVGFIAVGRRTGGSAAMSLGGWESAGPRRRGVARRCRRARGWGTRLDAATAAGCRRAVWGLGHGQGVGEGGVGALR